MVARVRRTIRSSVPCRTWMRSLVIQVKSRTIPLGCQVGPRQTKKGRGTGPRLSNWSSSYKPLKHVLQGKLRQPRLTRAGDAAEGARPDVAGGIVKLHVVPQVKDLGGELHAVLFGDPEFLEHRKVKVVQPGAVEHVAPHISPRPSAQGPTRPRSDTAKERVGRCCSAAPAGA